MTCKTYGVLAVLALAAACAPKIETQPVSAALEPMPERAPVVGDTTVWAEGDGQITRTVAQVSAGQALVEDSAGCSFTSAGFAPSTTWKNCDPFTDGSQSYTVEGDLFPLQVGNTASYAVKGSNVDGGDWETVRTCSVKGTAQVTVPAGTFDTYHVTCNDQFTTRDFYVAPEIQQTVLFRRLRQRQNETTVQKLVSFTPGL